MVYAGRGASWRTGRKRLCRAPIDIEASHRYSVNPKHLLSLLANAGCRNTFLRAIEECLRHTQNKLGNKTFVSKHGVRQGGATSCSLFTFYINSTIRKIKTYGPDGFLRDTHTLLFMDGTVLLATSPDGAEAEPPTLCYRTTQYESPSKEVAIPNC